MTDGIVPCVGCEKTVDALYCSYSCFEEDENRILESPITGELYYVTDWTEKGDGKFVAHKKQPIEWPDGEQADWPDRGV